jgi:hypothetical protein
LLEVVGNFSCRVVLSATKVADYFPCGFQQPFQSQNIDFQMFVKNSGFTLHEVAICPTYDAFGFIKL